MQEETKNHIKIAIEYIEKTTSLIDEFIEKHGDLYDDGADEYCFEIYMVLEKIVLELLEVCGIKLDVSHSYEIVPKGIALLKAYLGDD